MADEWGNFREWLKQKYPDTWEILLGQAIQDSFKTGGLEANNPFYRYWVQLGRPLTPELEAEEAATVEETTLSRDAELRAMLATGTMLASELKSQEEIDWITGLGWTLQTTDESGLRIAPSYVKPVSTVEEVGIADLPEDVKWYVAGSVWYSPSTKKYYDANGGEISAEDAVAMKNAWSRSITPTSDIPQWRPGELEFEQERFAWQKEQAGLADIEERHQMELQFEQDRNRLLQGLPSDDWIRRWVIQNQPNPYTEQAISPVDQLEAQLDTQTGLVQTLQANLTQASLAKNWELADKIRTELTDAVRARDTTYKDWNAMKQENINWSPQVPQPYPNAPGWIPQYVPGLVSGQMITRQNVVTPSGQQLTQMSPSQTGQLGYYADWAANYTGERQWRDILGEAQLMQPRTPFSGTRWSPAGARV